MLIFEEHSDECLFILKDFKRNISVITVQWLQRDLKKTHTIKNEVMMFFYFSKQHFTFVMKLYKQ